MLLNESPKSNPVPKWDETLKEFIFMGIIPGIISLVIYLLHPESLILSFSGLIAMLVAARGAIFFAVKIIRMNVESRKRK